VVSGQHDVGGANGWDAWLMGTNSQGKTLWLRGWTAAGAQQPFGLAAASGGWVLGGTTDTAKDGTDGWLLATDALGNGLWERHHGGPGTQRGMDLRALAGGGFAQVGYTVSAAGKSDAWLLRTDAWGQIDCAKSGDCALKKATLCDDKNACTVDLCGQSKCKHQVLDSGSPCADGKVCASTVCK
jgi:hypothetical protein